MDNLTKKSREAYMKYLGDYYDQHGSLPANIKKKVSTKTFFDWFYNKQTTYRKVDRSKSSARYIYSVFIDNEKRLHMLPRTLGIIMELIFKPINKIDFFHAVNRKSYYRPTISICSLKRSPSGIISSKSKNIKLCYYIESKSVAKYVLYLARIKYWNALLRESYNLNLITKNQMMMLSKLKPRDKIGNTLIQNQRYLNAAIDIFQKKSISKIIDDAVKTYSIPRLANLAEEIEDIQLVYKKKTEGEELCLKK